MQVTKEQIRNKEIKVFYHVVVFNGESWRVIEKLGNFDNLKEAKERCYYYWDRVTDGEGLLGIMIYKLIDNEYDLIEVIDKI